MARDQITVDALPGLSDNTPVTLVGSRDGYAVAVGSSERVQWLHTLSGQFRIFRSADRAIALLNTCGIRRIGLDLSGGTPQ